MVEQATCRSCRGKQSISSLLSPSGQSLLHSKKCSTIIKLFKKLSTTEKVFILEKSNGKMLSNCNRNSRGQPSG